MLPALYPPADHILRGDAPGTWANNGPYKIVWHTTETKGLPSYDRDNDELDAEIAPHLTYDPATRKWYQDYKLTRPSESLRLHDDDMVIQVEIICYSNKSIVDTYGGGRIWVGDLPETAYQDLGSFVLWVNQFVNIPLTWPEPGRMTVAEFHAYNGHAGHAHVPDNTHWDPGVFDWRKLFRYVRQGEDMAILSDEAQEFWQDAYDKLQELDPPTDHTFAYWLVRHVRKHPNTGISADDVIDLIERTKHNVT